MQIKFTLDNHIPNFLDVVEGKVEKQLMLASKLLEAEIKKTLTGTRSGKLYRVPGTKKKYVASAPLQAPAVRLGHLRRQTQGFVEGRGYEAVGYVANPLEYSVYLEYGTNKMAIRPYFRKTMHQHKAEIEEIVREIFQ
jgi:HK97 gp10 family phage protein